MTIDYHRLKHWQFPEVHQSYTEKDCMLYALGVGIGADPLDPEQLRFVYEKGLKTMPTMAAVLGYPGFWMQHPETGIDWKRLLHGEQRLRVHRVLPVSGSIVGRTAVKSVTDKGAGKGAIVVVERTITEAVTGTPFATIDMLTFCRGDGGYSESGQPSDALGCALPTPPEAAPDEVCDLPTRPEAALLYRLSGDPNPLHADPAIAIGAGFDRPILHGLAVYGIAAHAILKRLCGYAPEMLREFNVRFAAPVYPGETIRTEMWLRDDTVYFRARSVERDCIVLSNGTAKLKI